MKISSFLEHDNNNLTLIRVLLSSMVIYYHAYALTGDDPKQDAIRSLVGFVSSGGLSVAMFFFVSGMLVCNSFMKNHNFIAYISSRFFRIFPALLVMIFLTVCLMGPLVTSLTVFDYFSNPKVYDYFLNNMLLDTRYELPGVFENNQYPNAVNGSLWTLRWEVICYMFLFFAGMGGFLRNRVLATLTCVAVILSVVTRQPWLTNTLGLNPAMLYLPMYFSVGCLFAIWKDVFIINVKVMFVFIFASVLLKDSATFEYLFYLTVAISLITIASLKFVLRLRMKYDISYGIYIYGFVIQQVVALYLPYADHNVNALLSLSICLILGFISYKYVELPAINFGKKIVENLSSKRRVYSS